MIKGNAQLLNALIEEIEDTIINKTASRMGNIEKVAKKAVLGLNHSALLNGKHLPLDLKNELGFLIQTYGNELLYFINQHCPPMSFSIAISAFILTKEKYRIKILEKKLNRYIDIEDIVIYRLADYLTLGYPFFDSLFYVYFHRYYPNKYNVWGLVSNTEYEKPDFKIKKSTPPLTSASLIKNKPKKSP